MFSPTATPAPARLAILARNAGGALGRGLSGLSGLALRLRLGRLWLWLGLLLLLGALLLLALRASLLGFLPALRRALALTVGVGVGLVLAAPPGRRGVGLALLALLARSLAVFAAAAPASTTASPALAGRGLFG